MFSMCFFVFRGSGFSPQDPVDGGTQVDLEVNCHGLLLWRGGL